MSLKSICLIIDCPNYTLISFYTQKSKSLLLCASFDKAGHNYGLFNDRYEFGVVLVTNGSIVPKSEFKLRKYLLCNLVKELLSCWL